jgi:hypothetical protein
VPDSASVHRVSHGELFRCGARRKISGRLQWEPSEKNLTRDIEMFLHACVIKRSADFTRLPDEVAAVICKSSTYEDRGYETPWATGFNFQRLAVAAGGGGPQSVTVRLCRSQHHAVALGSVLHIDGDVHTIHHIASLLGGGTPPPKRRPSVCHPIPKKGVLCEGNTQ